MPPLVTALVTALIALVITDALCEILRRFALRYGLTDRPCARKAHVRPVPYLGGVGIVVGTLVPAVMVTSRHNDYLVVILAGAAIALVGLADDVKSLPATPRLLAEAVAATAVVLSGGRIAIFGNWLDLVITVLWIVLQTNSFNLLDNMDGAAATIAIVSASFLAATAYLAGEAGFALLLLSLTAGCAGFLTHNWAPARMFMGDAGSLFIGFVLSAAAVHIDMPGPPTAGIAGLFLLTFVATVDTGLVLVSRRRAGRSILTGGTDHTSHRLRRIGLGTRMIMLVLLVSTALSCLGGLLVVGGRSPLPAEGMLAVAVAGAITWIWLLLKVPVYAQSKRREHPESPLHTRTSGRSAYESAEQSPANMASSVAQHAPQ